MEATAPTAPTAPADELLTVKELGFRLGVPVKSLLNWVQRGALQFRGARPTGGPGTGTAHRLMGLYSLNAARALAAVYHANKAARA